MQLVLSRDEVVATLENGLQRAISLVPNLPDPEDVRAQMGLLMEQMVLRVAGVLEANNRRLEEQLKELGILPRE